MSETHTAATPQARNPSEAIGGRNRSAQSPVPPTRGPTARLSEEQKEKLKPKPLASDRALWLLPAAPPLLEEDFANGGECMHALDEFPGA